MSKIMLINVTHAEESRVGIVEDGQLESFEIESFSREHLKGNIYKGIIRRIHPAIEAAFVDIGADRDAFLPLDEICFRNLPVGRDGASGEKGRRRIKDVLKSGDEILVQIVKEQFTNKPPTLSTFYSLPGRYLVLLPGSDETGISRRIEGEDRIRIRELLERLHPPSGCGLIVRTAAGFDEDQHELERDLGYLQRLWESIKKHAATKRAPALVYREHDLVLRNIRDYFTPDINEIFIDNEEVCERAKDFLHNVMPGKEHLLHLYQGEQPIFSRFGLEQQIESIYKRRVQLKSGGSIVIDGTEALTAIDVNSGGSMRGTNQEETAYKTNLEAAAEIARQLRLRDLGGIIVIDFIDMRSPAHIAEVERTLRDAMRPDKARHDVGRISRLGLLEISRQRLRPAAAASSYTACPMCEGHGAVRTTESAALVALRKVHHRVAEGDVAQMKVQLPHEAALYLLNQKREDLAVLEARYAARIQIVPSDKLMPHQCEIETRTRDVVARAAPVVRPGEVAAADAVVPINGAGVGRRAELGARREVGGGERRTGTGSLKTEPAEARSRRRRRRGGRGRREATAEAPRELPAVGSALEAGSETVADESTLASAAVGEGALDLEVGFAGEVRTDVRERAVETAVRPPTVESTGRAEWDEAMSPPAALMLSTASARATDAEMQHAPAAEHVSGTTSAAPERGLGDPSEPTAAADDRSAGPEPAGISVASGGQQRRRRRRGGRRGGRGRRPAASGDAGAETRASEPFGAGAPEGGASSADEAQPTGEQASPGSSGAPRRRRGGARRRRPRTRTHGPESGAAEPPLES